MNHLKETGQKSGIINTFIVIIFLLAAGGIYIFLTVQDYQIETKTNALLLAESAKAFIPINAVEELQAEPDDVMLNEYQKIKNSLIEFRRLNKDVEFAYLFTRADGKLYFLVDSEPSGSARYAPPGQEYYEATDLDMQPFMSGESLLTGASHDRRGAWISALVPLQDPQTGEVKAVFGIDYSAAVWNRGLILRILRSAIEVFCIWIVAAIMYRLHSKNLELKSLSIKLRDSERLFRKVFEQAPIGISIVRDNMTLSNINPEFLRIVARSKEEMLNTSWGDITHPDDLQEDTSLFEKFQSGEIDSYAMEKRYLKPDGTSCWVNMVVASLDLRECNGRAVHDYLCIVEDIHERKMAENALRESERSKEALLSNLPGLAYQCRYDKQWTMLFLSEGCLSLTGYRPEQLLNNNDISFNDLILPAYRRAIWQEWSKMLLAHKRFHYEYEITTASGERKWVLEMGQGVYAADGSVEALEGIIIDISETKKQFMQIQYMNDHDFMTGLYNRKYYEEVKASMEQQNVLPFSVVIADINGVRMINDAFGHTEGDHMIIETAKIIKRCCGDEDILARTGGDEFSILLPNTDRECAYERIQAIMEACETFNQKISDKARYINISIGFGTKQTASQSIDDAEKEAEEYMHKRKLLEHK